MPNTWRRIGTASVLTAAGAMLLMAGAVPTSAAGPDGTVAFGAYSYPRTGENEQRALQRLEGVAGRTLDTVRDFQLWNSSWPTSYQTWAINGGRTLLLSVKALRTNGQVVLWRDIANAQPGSTLHNNMVSWAQRVRNLGVPVYVTLNHEPEASASSRMGNDADFKAAWQAWVGVFRAQGATNARFNWIMTDYSFQVPASDRRYAAKWYPGDAYVDAISGDAYNWFTCRPGINTAWKSLGQIIEAQRVFGLAHPGKELWLTEYGTVEDPANPNRKAQWYTAAQALFKQPAYAQFVGVNQFDRGIDCKWPTDTSAAAAAAWRAWGNDPFYNGAGAPPPPPPPPPTGSKALLVVANPASLGGDAAIRTRVASLGYTVDVVDDSAVTAASTTGYDVVLVSQSTSTSAVNTKLRNVAVPVVVWKPFLYDDFAMAANDAVGSGGRSSVTITNATHPLAAGLSGTVTITSGTAPVGWATALPSAQVVATVPGGAALYVYRPGAALAGGVTAAGCRVGLPFSESGSTQMTTAGWTLFDRAVTWADNDC